VALLQTLRQRFHQRYCMFEQHLAALPPSDPPPVSGLDWQVLQHRAQAALFQDEPTVERFIARLLARHYLGVVVTVDKQWAAYVWMARPGHLRPPHIPASFEPEAYWLFSSATRPAFAGRGIYKFAMRLLLVEAFERGGTRRILADVEPQNVPPRRGTVSVGFAPAGLLDCSYCWIPRLVHYPWRAHWDRLAPHPPLPAP
jgi:hypothetical protein